MCTALLLDWAYPTIETEINVHADGRLCNTISKIPEDNNRMESMRQLMAQSAINCLALD